MGHTMTPQEARKARVYSESESQQAIYISSGNLRSAGRFPAFADYGFPAYWRERNAIVDQHTLPTAAITRFDVRTVAKESSATKG